MLACPASWGEGGHSRAGCPDGVVRWSSDYSDDQEFVHRVSVEVTFEFRDPH
jgi:hypothetical protein